jgi:mono/diheme cytochrome c family protein
MLRDDTHFYEGRVDGVFVNTLPAQLTLDQDLLERGAERFGIYCTPCHGDSGAGNGLVVARGYALPPSLHDETRRYRELGFIFDTISNGSAAKLMPSYRSQIPARDRWAITVYVRALQLSQTLASASQTP